MVDPRTSLAIDAPALAPYDDGFSTESDDPDSLDETHDNELYIAVSAVVRSAVVGENQSKLHHVPKTAKVAKQEKKKTLQINSMPAVKTKATRNGGVKTEEEHCRNCRGYLTPLVERLKAMRIAASQCSGKSPPLSKQCCCCRITYPLVALTDESRRQSWPEPRCYMCYWAVRAVKKNVDAVKREMNGSVKSVDTGDGRRDEGDECCRSCKGKLTPLEQRLKKMKEAVLLHKGSGPPASRQCSCCRITYPMAALSTKGKALSCDTPVCVMCESSAASVETKAPSSDAVAATNLAKSYVSATKKTVEIIELDGEEDDEEGELLEEMQCKCCYGELIPLSQRVQMMKDSARQHGGKNPPPSRQCACCCITYPSAALTAKSRKMTRVVPICLNCCKAGGSTIYEMLAVSDKFMEAFKVENPAMARQLLAKKESGSLAKQVKRHQERMRPTQPVKKVIGVTELKSSEETEVIPRAVYTPRPLMARKVISAPRALLVHGMTGTAAMRLWRRPMARKVRNAPRQLLGQGVPAVTSTGEQANAAVSDISQPTNAAVSGLTQPLSPVTPRTSRWVQQFELVDGKTARARRIEKRNETKERRLEKKRQRTE